MVTRANTALNVIGDKKIDRRLQDLQRRIRAHGTLFRQAIPMLVREVIKRIPVRTGRLYRSFRIQITDTQLIMRYTAPYAIYANERSKLNRRYIQRGLRAGIARANALRLNLGGGLTAALRLRTQRVGRYGRQGSAEVVINYAIRVT